MSNKLDYKLVWKYFFGQKIDEILKLLDYIIMSPFILVYYLGYLILSILKSWWDECYDDLEEIFYCFIPIGILGFIFSFMVGAYDINNGYTWKPLLGFLIIYVILILLSVLFWWIQENWKEAKDRAKKDGIKK